MGRQAEARKLHVQVMEAMKRVLGPEHSETLEVMVSLANTYSEQDRWVEAEKLEVQVMEMRKRVLGPDHPETLDIIFNLALS